MFMSVLLIIVKGVIVCLFTGIISKTITRNNYIIVDNLQ